jgi:VanZ family protein
MSNSASGAVRKVPLPLNSNIEEKKHRNSGPGFWIRVWWPVALGIAIICLESTTIMGADHTSHPLRMIVEFFTGRMSDRDWAVLHYHIRKCGHFTGYGLLCLTWLRAWRMTLPQLQFSVDAIYALLCTAVVASADEFHQTFLPNRTGTPWDVLIDCSGGAVLTLITWAILAFVRPELVRNKPMSK